MTTQSSGCVSLLIAFGFCLAHGAAENLPKYKHKGYEGRWTMLWTKTQTCVIKKDQYGNDVTEWRDEGEPKGEVVPYPDVPESKRSWQGPYDQVKKSIPNICPDDRRYQFLMWVFEPVDCQMSGGAWNERSRDTTRSPAVRVIEKRDSWGWSGQIRYAVSIAATR